MRHRSLCWTVAINFTCKPYLSDFRALAEKVIAPVLNADAAPTVWALEFKSRNTTTLKKEAALEVIDSFVAKDRHKVSIDDPEIMILVEVNPMFCGVSLLRRWKELRKYNLNALTTP